MPRFSGPEKIKINEQNDPEKEGGKGVSEIKLSSAAEIFRSQEKISEIIKKDAKAIAKLIERVKQIEEGSVTPKERNEINKNRARIQDIVSGHFVRLKTVPRDITEAYLPALISSIDNQKQASVIEEVFQDQQFVDGIKSHARSVLKACQHRKEQEVAGTEMDPFTTMYIGSSELLDANYKVDYCNLRWMPPKNEGSMPYLRLDLVQAKTAFPVSSEGDPMQEVKLIMSQHKHAAEKFLIGPKLYENFEDIEVQLEPLITSAFFDIIGEQTGDYKNNPSDTLFETMLAKNFPAVFRGEMEKITMEDVESEQKLNLKEDLRAMLILRKEIEEQPDITLEKIEGLIKEQTEQYQVPKDSNMKHDEVEKLLRSAFLELTGELDPETLLTEQPIELYSVTDATESRVIVKTDKEGKKKKQNVSRYEKKLADTIDKKPFGVYFIKTENLVNLIREHESVE